MRRQRGSVILIGFMGSGKSTAGIGLSYKLQCTLTDTDKMIERQEGRSIFARNIGVCSASWER